MSNRTSKDFLSDIQEATRRVKVYTTGMTYEAFLADTRTQDAVIRNLEIIGEATKNLSTSHMASFSYTALIERRKKLGRQVATALSGKLPKDGVVNPEVNGEKLVD